MQNHVRGPACFWSHRWFANCEKTPNVPRSRYFSYTIIVNTLAPRDAKRYSRLEGTPTNVTEEETKQENGPRYDNLCPRWDLGLFEGATMHSRAAIAFCAILPLTRSRTIYFSICENGKYRYPEKRISNALIEIPCLRLRHWFLFIILHEKSKIVISTKLYVQVLVPFRGFVYFYQNHA